MTAARECDHAHGPPLSQAAVEAALARAEARADEHGQRWTESRRRVYELLLRAGAPVKAYDLMERYAEHRAAKPPTVYRALEFLEQSGLAHRIASLNAYVSCEVSSPDHSAAFLICDCCGSAEEFQPGPVPSASRAAAAHGFTPRDVTMEVRGRCRACA